MGLPSSSMSTSLRSVWSDKKESKPWPESRQTGLGLDQLGTRMAQTNDEELRVRLEKNFGELGIQPRPGETQNTSDVMTVLTICQAKICYACYVFMIILYLY